MILLLDRNAIDCRAIESGLSVADVMSGFKVEFPNEDYANGYFDGLLGGTIQFRLLNNSHVLCSKLNKALSDGKCFPWYAHNIVINVGN